MALVKILTIAIAGTIRHFIITTIFVSQHTVLYGTKQWDSLSKAQHLRIESNNVPLKKKKKNKNKGHFHIKKPLNSITAPIRFVRQCNIHSSMSIKMSDYSTSWKKANKYLSLIQTIFCA